MHASQGDIQDAPKPHTESKLHSSGVKAATRSSVARYSAIAAFANLCTSSGVCVHVGGAWGAVSGDVIVCQLAWSRLYKSWGRPSVVMLPADAPAYVYKKVEVVFCST